MADLFGSASVSDGTNNVAVLRITLIGASGSGKSALANAFVNNVVIYEHQPTTDLTLYYTRVEIKSDDGPFYALVEIEDTWSSNKVNPDQMQLLYDPWWPLTQKQAMDATKTDKKSKQPGSHKGGRFAVCQCGHGRSDHEGGDGPCKVAPFTCEQFQEEVPNVLNPFSGSAPPEIYRERSANNPEPFDMDREGRKYRPLTRNRMAYFLLFDTNDMDSYKEALDQEKALKEHLQRRQIKVQPIVFLVGTKIDVDPDSTTFKSVQFSANSKSVREAIRYKEVSSVKYQGVRKLFREAVQSIRSKQSLWLLEHGIRNKDDELKADGCCVQ